MYNDTWSRKPLHSTASPEYEKGRAMGLAEANKGVVTGVREARRVLMNSLKASAGAGRRGSMSELRMFGLVFCEQTHRRHKGKSAQQQVY